MYFMFAFYRATHMHNADYAVEKCLSVCLPICLSVCPLHAGILSIQLYTVFSPSGSPTSLVFPYQTGWQYSDEDPINGGVECKVV